MSGSPRLWILLLQALAELGTSCKELFRGQQLGCQVGLALLVWTGLGTGGSQHRAQPHHILLFARTWGGALDRMTENQLSTEGHLNHHPWLVFLVPQTLLSTLGLKMPDGFLDDPGSGPALGAQLDTSLSAVSEFSRN